MSHPHTQPDDMPAVSDALAWIASHRIKSADSSDRHFIPRDALFSYFTTQRVQSILSALFGDKQQIQPRQIRNHLIGFAILLRIRAGQYIQTFANDPNLADTLLPLRHLPSLREDQLPATLNARLWAEFDKEQWQFCAYAFALDPADINIRIDDRFVLPFTDKEPLDDGFSSQVYKIKIHPHYICLQSSEAGTEVRL